MSNFVRLTWQCFRVFLAHYRHSPLQAGGILLGVTLAVTLLVGVRATNDNAIRSYSESTELLSQRATAMLVANNGDLDEAWYFKLRQSKLRTPLAIVTGYVLDAEGKRWEIQGSDLVAAMSTMQHQTNADQSTASYGQAPAIDFNALPLAALISGQPMLIMGESLAARIAPQGIFALESGTVKVVTVKDDLGLGNHIIADISYAQQLLGKTGKLSYIALFDPQESVEQQLQNALGLQYDQTLQLIKRDNGEALTALTQSFHLNLNAMSLLAFVVGLFIAYNGVRYSLLKRQTLLVKLLQHGIDRQSLMAGLLCELLVLVVIGSSIGFIFGLQLSQWLQPLVALTLEQLYGAQLLPGKFEWVWLYQAIALTSVAAGFACIPLYLQLSRQPLARSASRITLQSSAETQNKRLFKMSISMLIIAGLAVPFSQQFEYSLLLMGMVIVAIPLLLPLALQTSCQALASFITKLNLNVKTKVLWHYSIAETRELIAPLSLAMMAMLLALCANIAMNTLVSSFDITLRQWLENRLHADIYLRPDLSKYDALLQMLEKEKSVTGIYEQWNGRVHLNGAPTNVTTRDDYSLRYTSVLKEHADDFWDAFLTGQSVMISEPLAIKQGFKIGDRLSKREIAGNDYIKLMDGINPASETVPISAIFYDYGNPLGEIMMGQPLWQDLQHHANLKSVAITTSVPPQPLVEQIQQTFSMSSADIYSQQKIKNQAMKMFAQTFSITSVLNSLTLLVAGIGLFSAVLMLTQSRQAPLARLYALGVSRPQIRTSVFVQMLIIILLSALVAIPTGAVLSYLLINKVTLQAFGWSIPMVWSWLDCIKLILIALITGALAVGLPLYWQTRKPLVSSLQQETM